MIYSDIFLLLVQVSDCKFGEILSGYNNLSIKMIQLIPFISVPGKIFKVFKSLYLLNFKREVYTNLFYC